MHETTQDETRAKNTTKRETNLNKTGEKEELFQAGGRTQGEMYIRSNNSNSVTTSKGGGGRQYNARYIVRGGGSDVDRSRQQLKRRIKGKRREARKQ